MVGLLLKLAFAIEEVEVFFLTWDVEIFCALMFVALMVVGAWLGWKHREWFIIREGAEGDD